MTSSKEICRLCRIDTENDNFDFINDNTIEILNVLRIHLYLDKSSSQVICNGCSEKMSAAFDFKTTCICTDTAIIPYVSSGEPLDLKDIYLRERDSKQAVLLADEEKVCRLCMELTGNQFLPVQEMEVDNFQKFLPEINLNLVRNAVVCKFCIESFSIYSGFVKNCLNVQEKMQDSGQFEKVFDEDPLQGCIKMEEVNIKTENDISFDSNIKRDMFKVKIEANELIKTEENESNTEKSRDNLSTSEIHPVAPGESRRLKRRVKPKKSKGNIVPIQSKTSSQVRVHKCDTCNFQSKYKKGLKVHQLQHKDPSQVQMFKCSSCHYKTKIRGSLKSHQLSHKDPSEVQMYKCDVCDYQTKYNGAFRKHQLIHKDRSQIPTYKCDECEYETITKGRLKNHQFVHKDRSQFQMYKCDDCGYETRYKYHMKNHELLHKDPAHVNVFKCDLCNYKAIKKVNLKRHELKHKDPSQVQMHKCDVCVYETKYKGQLKMHQLIHKDPSQIRMYKCEICDYKTKYKGQLNLHQLKHKTGSRVKFTQCDMRDQTKFKEYLKSRMHSLYVNNSKFKLY